MRVKVFNNRIKVFNNRSKYFRYDASKTVITTIQADVSLNTNDRFYADYSVGMNINEGLWSKHKAFYGILGGTAATHKWNWKDLRNLDAAFRLSFIGGFTHDQNGSRGNGTNGYADTFLVPSTSLSLNNTHISFYANTVTSKTVNVEISVYDNNSRALTLVVRRNNNFSIGVSYEDNVTLNVNETNGLGMFIENKISSNSHSLFIRGNKNTGNAAGTLPTNKIYLWNANVQNNVGNQWSDIRSGFISIGDGLTDVEALNLSNIITFAQNILGRA